MEVLRIPEKRVSVLRGPKGSTLKALERRCKIKLHVYPDGEVELDGEETEVYFAREVVQAIGRGFEPQQAMKLLKDNYQLHIIHLREYAHTPNAVTRIKGRVIGEEGKIKLEIENATDAYLSIYGNTVSVIAPLDSMEYAKEAVAKLIHGARHSNVLGYLARIRKQLLSERLGAGT